MGHKYGSKHNPFNYADDHPRVRPAGWKGNPYHLPKGPSGGQFTSGPSSPAAQKIQNREYDHKEHAAARRAIKVRGNRIEKFLSHDD